MKITREQLKGIVREVMTEESEYQTFFKKALEKTGKSIPQMSDEEKKKFFNKIDAAWKGKGEKNESVNEARNVSKPIKVNDDTMIQIVGDSKGFRELTAALNPKTGKPIQKFGFDRGNEIANSKEELVKKLQKKYGKNIKFESINEAKNDNDYVVIDFHEKGGGFVMTKPGSKKDAEDSARSIRKGSDISKREVLKVSDARKIRGLAGKQYLK